ncbi:hypothetical protein L3X38_018882 [Prunus dulcis]|uniref:peroxidase n=1 Tax=Prunus dulcis TaxID=3755 RepID=A0AAD4ZB55_PRUDU|nr:hypothetical protein L3X38_018882 [Prunus dulcis]
MISLLRRLSTSPPLHMERDHDTNMTISQIINLFASKKLSVQDMVVLSGAHTIGFSHCKEFSNRIFNFSKTSDIGPCRSRTLQRGLGLLSTDQALMADERTKPLVDLYASNEKRKEKKEGVSVGRVNGRSRGSAGAQEKANNGGGRWSQ